MRCDGSSGVIDSMSSNVVTSALANITRVASVECAVAAAAVVTAGKPKLAPDPVSMCAMDLMSDPCASVFPATAS